MQKPEQPQANNFQHLHQIFTTLIITAEISSQANILMHKQINCVIWYPATFCLYNESISLVCSFVCLLVACSCSWSMVWGGLILLSKQLFEFPRKDLFCLALTAMCVCVCVCAIGFFAVFRKRRLFLLVLFFLVIWSSNDKLTNNFQHTTTLNLTHTLERALNYNIRKCTHTFNILIYCFRSHFFAIAIVTIAVVVDVVVVVVIITAAVVAVQFICIFFRRLVSAVDETRNESRQWKQKPMQAHTKKGNQQGKIRRNINFEQLSAIFPHCRSSALTLLLSIFDSFVRFSFYLGFSFDILCFFLTFFSLLLLLRKHDIISMPVFYSDFFSLRSFLSHPHSHLTDSPPDLFVPNFIRCSFCFLHLSISNQFALWFQGLSTVFRCFDFSYQSS